jgi:hypothetical protein
MNFTCPRRYEQFHSVPQEDADHWRDAGTCSYCGSLSPSKFFEALYAGTELGPTNKNYKVYVGGTSKFYFQHLSEDQRNEFITAYNDHIITIGYPGYFYVLPFFCRSLKVEHDEL